MSIAQTCEACAESMIPFQVPDAVWRWGNGRSAGAHWDLWARETAVWLEGHGLTARDLLVTVPVGALLRPVREAWARAVGGWLPRVDTIAGLMTDAAWRTEPSGMGGDLEALFGHALTLDAVRDRLVARLSLGQQAWAKAWRRRDPRAHDLAMERTVEAAHACLRALQGVPPRLRPQWAQRWRGVLQPVQGGIPDGPGGRERLLLSWALEWALASAEAGLSGDAVHALDVSAWVGITVGQLALPGSEVAWMLSAMGEARHRGARVRWVAASAPWPVPPDGGAPTVHACAHALDEARQAVALVQDLLAPEAPALGATNASEAEPEPVALIALDRSVVRHARALLAARGLHVQDETGWRLSTTRAAAACQRLLAAAQPGASTETLLDWLKSGWIDGPGLSTLWADPLRVQIGLLESAWRVQGGMRAWPVPAPGGTHAGLAPQARELWQWSAQVLSPLQGLAQSEGGRSHSLWQWLQGLHQSLCACGAMAHLRCDPAGQALLLALGLGRWDIPAQGAPGLLDEQLLRDTRMDASAFQRWLSQVMEETSHREPAELDADGTSVRPDVVITTLARATLRGFRAVVMPGAHDRQLGALAPPGGWLGSGLRSSMGLATPEAMRLSQREALALLVTQSPVHVLYATDSGGEAREASPWLAAWPRASAPATRWRPLSPQCVPRPAPEPARLGLMPPAQVSATRYDTLRQCPYRYFALSMLGLKAQDELDEGLDRSDLGQWLHDVLRRFHEALDARLQRLDVPQGVALWHECAEAAARARGWDHSSVRPFYRSTQATVAGLAQAYVSWWMAREAEGWQVRHMELALKRNLTLPDGSPLTLVGQLDRIDMRFKDKGHEVSVLDYKTGQAAKLRARAASGGEDTQLVFYVLLMAAESGQVQLPEQGLVGALVQAAYVHVDTKGVQRFEHAQASHSAEQLLDGLQADWTRLRAGAAMPALGEGDACAHCELAGLCRRRRWTEMNAAETSSGHA